MISQINKPEWYNTKKNQLIIDSNDTSFYNVSFSKHDNNIKTSIFKSDTLPLIKYEPNKEYNYEESALKLINKFHSNFIKIKKNKERNTLLKNAKHFLIIFYVKPKILFLV